MPLIRIRSREVARDPNLLPQLGKETSPRDGARPGEWRPRAERSPTDYHRFGRFVLARFGPFGLIFPSGCLKMERPDFFWHA